MHSVLFHCCTWVVVAASWQGPSWVSPRTARQFTNEEYLAFLRSLPVTRSDWANSNWLGEPRIKLLPHFLTRFDWLYDHTDWAHRDPETYRVVKRLNFTTPDKKRRRDPRTVFATPYAVERVIAKAERGGGLAEGVAHAAKRVLVLAGSDQLLSLAFGDTPESRAATVARLRRYFGTIFYMAKDVEVDGVRAMPIGVLEHYVRQAQVAELASDAIAQARIDDSAKDRHALLAVGGYGDYSRNATCCDNRPRSYENRQAALRWSLSPSGGRANVEVRNLHATHWWRELSRYRFLIAPWGDGIQSAKTIEALLVLTVPIIQRGPFRVFDELVELGFPYVLVDDWEEVTSEFLDARWRLLSPRLEQFRRRCLSADGYWSLVTRGLQTCGG